LYSSPLSPYTTLFRSMKSGRAVVSASFIIPYPPGFPILVPGQVISQEILDSLRARDVTELHGYRADLGLRVFTQEALERHAAKRSEEHTSELQSRENL